MGRLVLVVDCCFFSAILSKTTLSLSKIGNASDLLAAMVRDDEICRPMEPKYISWEEKRAREDSIACNTHRLPWTRSDLSHCRFSLIADFLSLPIFVPCPFSCLARFLDILRNMDGCVTFSPSRSPASGYC
jgi:hypothetical protein